MRIVFKNIKERPLHLMRRAGYSFKGEDPKTGEKSFVKRFRADEYPRFHAYVEKEDGDLAINLHLDQKRPSYAGAVAHSGEYDGKIVEEEAQRIKNAINKELSAKD